MPILRVLYMTLIMIQSTRSSAGDSGRAYVNQEEMVQIYEPCASSITIFAMKDTSLAEAQSKAKSFIAVLPPAPFFK